MGVFEGKFPQWAYLIGYNTISAILWDAVFSSAAVVALTRGLDEVYPALRTWVLVAQTVAVLDIMHCITGLVHAQLLTTLVQVAGRLTILWIVIEPYPSAALSPFYAWMVMAWSAADLIRYLYYAIKLVGGHQYHNLTWLRYSAFQILYPIGIAAEFGVVYNAISEAFRLGHSGHAWQYIAAAALYIPAVPTLYIHMRQQRRKVLAAKKR